VTADSSAPSAAPALRRNAIGLPAALFQSITTMAPASAVAFSLGAAIPFAGGALPLTVFIALLVCALIAVNIGALAKHLPSAGGFYTYVSHGLGPQVGWLTGWFFSLTYLLIVPLQLLVLGPVADSFTQTYFHFSWGWPVWAVIFAVIIFGLTYSGIKISADTSVVLGTIEIVVFVALALTLIVTAGGANTAAAFNPASSADPRLGGWQGILHGVIFAFLAFAGFESSAPLAEETQNPRRTVPRAILYATISIGLFYVLCSYAGVVGWGFNKLGDYVANPDPWGTMAGRVWGAFSVIVILAILNSALANANSGVNAATRVLYAMGRVGTLPTPLAQINRRFQTPGVAIILTMVVGIVLTLWPGLVYGPTQAFGLLGIIITILILLVYMATCLAVPFYYRRELPQEFNILRHVIVPIVPAIILVFPIYAQFVPAPPFPYNLAAPICAAWFVIGLVIVLVMTFTARSRLADGAKIYVDA
jgi:amino acid transporter